MINAIYNGLAGMTAATRQISVAASNIANANSASYTPLSPEQTSGPGGAPTVEVRPVQASYLPASDSQSSAAGPNGTAATSVDPVHELLQMLQAQQSFAANAKTERTVSEIFHSLYGSQD